MSDSDHAPDAESERKSRERRTTFIVAGAVFGGLGVVTFAQRMSEEVASSSFLTLAAVSSGAFLGGVLGWLFGRSRAGKD